MMLKENKTGILKSVLSLIMIISLVCCSIFALGINSFAASVGDVNGDGKINSTDALLILQSATGVVNLTDNQKKLADVNGDGRVNSSDALQVLFYATGNPSVIKPTEPTTKTTASTTTSSTTQPTTRDLSFSGTVTADPSLRLRSGAGTSYAVLANIPYGTVLTITQTNGNWGKTTYNGKTGWVSLDYIEVYKPASGTFTVTSYGYGHGVGMSQYGAKYYADQGWTYDKILLHYFYSSKTKISTDTSMPSTVTYGGKSMPLKQYIAGSVKAEMGDSWNIEAIKAQLVAIYTYAKYYGFKVNSSTHAYKDGYNYSGTKIETAMNSVLGKYISYDGKAILSVYCASMGGKNTSAAKTWLGSDIPYLQGGRTSPEPESITKRVYTFTADEMKTMAKKNLGATLSGDPSKWFTNIVHDKSVSNSVGYIISMNVGDKTVKGENVRTKLFKYKVRSHCLSIVYNP